MGKSGEIVKAVSPLRKRASAPESFNKALESLEKIIEKNQNQFNISRSSPTPPEGGAFIDSVGIQSPYISTARPQKTSCRSYSRCRKESIKDVERKYTKCSKT